MTKRMLIDATQPEETRVVLTSGNRVEDFDFETASRRQLKGNIYLARVTRVEPSLQAAFVEYGGNRHGFLAFNEIHPDYYRIPMEDREALLAEQQAHDAEDVEDLDDDPDDGSDDGSDDAVDDDNPDMEASAGDDEASASDGDGDDSQETVEAGDDAEVASETSSEDHNGAESTETAEASEAAADDANDGGPKADEDEPKADSDETNANPDGGNETNEDAPDQQTAKAEAGPRRRSKTERSSRRPSHRRYRIQEVVTRRQIMLVQVVKEERGNKGAALTTFLSLAGRYCVLMPNTPRGGGVSRKITNAVDRKRLKSVVEGLDVPKDMAVIVRTAGSQRTKTEIKRDYEYLLRLWDQIRELTLESSAPCLVHEEANLIKRSIRDLYTRDIDEVLVEGEEGYRTAKSFMKMLVPSHARRVQPFSNGGVPLFHNFQVESQLDGIHASTVQLRSGGYIVLNQTEALVAIDVNSGRSTRERNIEETALKTNLEAADEVARQLRLRDLAGLIVIDFIDMDESRNQNAVERRMKDVVKDDRARIQLGRISQFGLMELSRQRLRPSVAEASTQPCPHCEGTGRVRSIDSAALQVLRNIEDEGLKQRASEVVVHVPSAIGFYILNNKRDVLVSAEERYAFRVTLQPDDKLIAPEHRIERLGAKTASERNAVLSAIGANAAVTVIEDDDDDDQQVDAAESDDADDQRERRPRRRRRRSERGGRNEARATPEAEENTAGEPNDGERPSDDDEAGEDEDGNKRRRRRGKRGGRRRARRGQGEDGVENDNQNGSTDGAAYSSDQPISGDDETENSEVVASPDGDDTPMEASADDAPTEDAGPDVIPDAAPEATEEAPKKRAPRARRPRRRADAPEQASEEPTAQPATEETEAVVEEAAAPAEEPTTSIEPAAPAPVTDAAEEATNGAEQEPEVTPAVAVDPAQPARKGWWNRLLS
jgi:ribonuclease E